MSVNSSGVISLELSLWDCAVRLADFTIDVLRKPPRRFSHFSFCCAFFFQKPSLSVSRHFRVVRQIHPMVSCAPGSFFQLEVDVTRHNDTENTTSQLAEQWCS